MNLLTRVYEGVILPNFSLKLISLGVALAYFTYLHTAIEAQRSIEVNVVTLPSLSADRVLLTKIPSTVHVQLSGNKGMLNDVRMDELGTVQLDLRQEPSYAIFDTRTLSLPDGLERAVDPEGIRLVWDDRETRELPVQVPLTGKLAQGYAVETLRSSPTRVSVDGARSLVDQLDQLRAIPFDLSGLAEGQITRRLALEPPKEGVHLSEDTITVILSVVKSRQDKVFARVPVHVLGVPHATVTPSEVEVLVNGPPELISSMHMEQLNATVDVGPSGVDTKLPGTLSLPVEVSLDRCTTEVTPARVLVHWP